MLSQSILSWILHKPRTDLPAIVILWTFLSTVVSFICCYSFIHPFWLIHPDYIHSFGVYNYCFNHQTFYQQICDFYGGSFSFGHLPSEAWQAACVLLGSGCALMFISTICACLCLCLSRPCVQKLAIVGGGLQITAALVLILGVVVYPLGTDSTFLKYYCGSSGPYDKGHCMLGWSFMASVMGSALAVFCPILAYFVDHGKSPKETEVAL